MQRCRETTISVRNPRAEDHYIWQSKAFHKETSHSVRNSKAFAPQLESDTTCPGGGGRWTWDLGHIYIYIYICARASGPWPRPRGGWFSPLWVARAMGFFTEWLVSLQNGLGSHCAAILSFPEPPNETSWGTPLGFGVSDAAVHSVSVLQNH